MAITRLAISNPAANSDILMHTATRGSVASVIVTNKGGVSSSIRVWIVPSGQDATPANWIYIAYNVSVEAGNTMETFRFPLVSSDKLYIRSSTADCSFSLNSLYETNGRSNISAQSTAPASPQIGDVWVDTDDNKVYFWDGTSWVDAVTELPSQTGNSGKYLTTNGTSTSWGTIDLSGYATTTALSNHESDTTSIHGISNTADLVLTNDARLSNSRTPTSHASSHGSAGSDAITISQSQVTNLTTDLSGKASTSGTLAQFASTTSSQLAGIISDETGAGSLVFSSSPILTYPVFTSMEETVNIAATAATGTINLDVLTSSIWYFTSNSSGNWTLNIRGNSGTTFNSILNTGQSIAISFLVTNGATAYYQTALQIDGVSVTPKWGGGVAPTSGNVNSIDIYSISIIKTGSSAYTVIESQTRVA